MSNGRRDERWPPIPGHVVDAECAHEAVRGNPKADVIVDLSGYST